MQVQRYRLNQLVAFIATSFCFQLKQLLPFLCYHGELRDGGFVLSVACVSRSSEMSDGNNRIVLLGLVTVTVIHLNDNVRMC